MEHPFLADDFLVKWSRLTPDHIEADVAKGIAEGQAAIDAIAAQDKSSLTYDSVMQALEDATDLLGRVWGRVCHLDSNCNTDALREAKNAVLPQVTEFHARIPLNADLWAVIKAFAESDEGRALTGHRRRYLDETIADFQEAGADLPDDKKARLEELSGELAKVTQKYGENALDATNAWDLIVDDRDRLAGLPEREIAAAQQSALEKGIGSEDDPKWRFTLHYPSTMPVMRYLEDEDIRRQVWRASTDVGALEPHDNSELIWQILALRQEKAELLGKANFADQVLKRRMARDGATALTFVEDLFGRAKAAFDREVEAVQQFRADAEDGPRELLEPWDATLWCERQRKALYDFDDEELRPYFSVDKVIAGMFDITQRLYKLDIVERDTVFIEPGSGGDPGDAVEVWHPEVKFFDLYDEDGTHLGSFYTDWHPRETKRSGAWMAPIHTGRSKADGHEPHWGVICGNMTKPVGDQPALLSHREVETIFHEFGHLLHHLLGNVEVRSLSGTSVAWDFVELPSQIMENWCWDRRSLDIFARHYETGEPIPDVLFDKMLAARNYNAGIAMVRQLCLGKMDLELHIKYATDPQDLDALLNELLADYNVPYATETRPIIRRFTHLFNYPVGYAAAYYSYKWAEVLDADAFSRFQKEGLLNPEVGAAFRETILSKGNSAPPDQLYRDFMGRDPDPEALLVRAGLA